MLSILFHCIKSTNKNNNYAILMCGSKGYRNYRHQSDLYSWITLLRERGYDNTHIISLGYNDIKPPLFHIDHNREKLPLYVNIDYENIEASKFNFLNIISKPEHYNITGWLWKNKRHINNFNQEFTNDNNKHINLTGIYKQDINILIVYIGHGVNGMLCVPNRFDEDIYIEELTTAVNELSNYVNSITMIIEACFSGSFVLDGNWNDNIIVIAASGANQSSYSFGWSSELKTFTTDEFTYYIIDYLDNPLHNNNTIKDMVNYVSKNVHNSHIITIPNKLFNMKINNIFYNSRYRVFKHDGDFDAYNYYENNIPNIYSYNDRRVDIIINILNKHFDKNNNKHVNQCYRDVTKVCKQLCYQNDINEYNLYNVYKIGLLCNDYKTMDIIRVMNSMCY